MVILCDCFIPKHWPMKYIITKLHYNNIMERVVFGIAVSQIHIHTKGFGSLHRKISPKILPSEYGGDNGSLIDHWCK
jgi:hypothetical protein